MKRQTNDQITSRVYSYGSVPARVAPVHNEDLAQVQLKLASRLWNSLVAIERARKDRYRRIMHDEVAERIEALKLQRGAWRDEMKARRKGARKRQGVEVADLQAALDQSRDEMARLIAEHQSTRDRRHLAAQAELTANVERYNRRIVRARQAVAAGCYVDSARARNRRAHTSGGKEEIHRVKLYWGTYNDIIQRADAGRKHGGDLRFRGFRGQGTLTAQVMGGAAVDRCVEGDHTVFQIGPGIQGAPGPSGRDVVRTEARYARMRIGSNPDRSPVWLDVPIVYHREIPPNANIRSVSATRRIVGGQVSHQVNVTVNLPRAMGKSGPAIAVDIGWRLLPEGVRVAYWVDEPQGHGQVLIPIETIRQAEKVQELRALCDGLRNGFLPPLADWLDTQELPEEWKAKTAHLVQWRSGDRLAALIRWWGDHRLSGDGDAPSGPCPAKQFEAAEGWYGEAQWWRKRYLHLSNWRRNQQDQIVRRIREQYRIFAARVARDYGTVILEEFDLREVIELPEAEEEKAAPRNKYRQIVSPSAFRSALLQSCAREGVTIAKRPAAYTTRACHACGYEGKWDSAANVMHRCKKCGQLSDQDFGAATNLLRGWQADQGVAEPALVLA